MVRWFPDRRGFAARLAAAGYGSGVAVDRSSGAAARREGAAPRGQRPVTALRGRIAD
jgi:hypothetical protein